MVVSMPGIMDVPVEVSMASVSLCLVFRAAASFSWQLFHAFLRSFLLLSPSGKMILNTKKNTTMEIVPIKTVEPML